MANTFARVTILNGRLTRYAEIKSFANGTGVIKMTVATNESYKDKDGVWQDKPQFHNVDIMTISGRATKTIETLANLTKGTPVSLEGKLEYSKYTDAEGVEKYITTIKCWPMDVHPAINSGTTAQDTPTATAPPPVTAPPAAPATTPSVQPPLPEDDLPF